MSGAAPQDGAARQVSPLRHPHQLVFCGFSGSGKTTLLVKLIELLAGEYRIGYLKHDAHGFEMDRPGKDTHRAAAAGAVEVLINDAARYAHISANPPGMFDAGLALLDCDWVLIEGYRDSELPKVLVLDSAGRAEAAWRAGRFRNVIACAYPGDVPVSLPAPVPCFPRDDTLAIAEFVRAFWRGITAAVPLHGLVLAGASSEGTGPEMWVQAPYLQRLLGRYCTRSYIAVQADEAEHPLLAGAPLLIDRFPELGPLGGLLTAMERHPEAAWVVLSCGLPGAEADVIERLLARRAPLRLATARRNPADGGPEPLCAIYEPRARLRLFQALALGCREPAMVLSHSAVQLVESEPRLEVGFPDRPHGSQAAARTTSAAPARRGDLMKSVTLHYYASLREARGCASETLATGATTMRELYEELRARHGLPLPASSLQVAVNDEFASWEQQVADGDVVVFIAPVAGG